MTWKKPTQALPVIIIGAGPSGLIVAQGLLSQSIPFLLFDLLPGSCSAQGHRFRLLNTTIAGVKSVLPPWLNEILDRTTPQGSLHGYGRVNARDLEFGTPVDISISKPVDRTWFRKLLTLGLEQYIEYNKHFVSYSLNADNSVTAHFSDSTKVRGAALIGADGIKSLVRKQFQPDRKLLNLERWAMWGRTPLKSVPAESADRFTALCMVLDDENKMQAVIDPVRWSQSVMKESGERLPDFEDYIYWVVTKADTSTEGLPKSPSTRKAFLAEAVRDWYPALRAMLDAGLHDLSRCVPAVSSRPDIQLEVTDDAPPVITIGDAAHGMALMGAFGANTAILTAVDFVDTVKQGGLTEAGMKLFQQRMSERGRTMIEKCLDQGEKTWCGKHWTEYKEHPDF